MKFQAQVKVVVLHLAALQVRITKKTKSILNLRHLNRKTSKPKFLKLKKTTQFGTVQWQAALALQIVILKRNLRGDNTIKLLILSNIYLIIFSIESSRNDRRSPNRRNDCEQKNTRSDENRNRRSPPRKDNNKKDDRSYHDRNGNRGQNDRRRERSPEQYQRRPNDEGSRNKVRNDDFQDNRRNDQNRKRNDQPARNNNDRRMDDRRDNDRKRSHSGERDRSNNNRKDERSNNNRRDGFSNVKRIDERSNDNRNEEFSNDNRKDERSNENRRNERPNNRKQRRPNNNEDEGNFEWGKKDTKNEEEDEVPVEKEKPNFGLSGKLTEDTNKMNGVIIKYSEPPEAKKPKRRWRFYPFKGEKAMATLYLHRQSAFLIGRDRVICDLAVDHPSCSKQHAVLQYRLVILFLIKLNYDINLINLF